MYSYFQQKQKIYAFDVQRRELNEMRLKKGQQIPVQSVGITLNGELYIIGGKFGS